MADDVEWPGYRFLGVGLLAIALFRAASVLDAAEARGTIAADAVPVFLSALITADHGDPTSTAAMEERARTTTLPPGAFRVSTLYPASAGVLAQPLAVGGWEPFVDRWRTLLVAGAVASGALAGYASVTGTAGWTAAGVGAWIAVGLFPVTIECVHLGQVNLLIAALLAGAGAAASRGRFALSAVAATSGGAIKLVPVFALWPLLLARPRAVIVSTLVLGIALLGLTVTYVPLGATLSGVANTLAFQSGVRPDWMVRNPAPGWMVAVGTFRHLPMGVVTALVSALAFRGSREVIATAVMLIAAWLGADAAGFHVLYTPLYLPALVYTAAWGLAPSAPRWAWGFVALAFVPSVLAAWQVPGLVVEARLVLAGVVIWAATAARLLWIARPDRRVLIGLAVALLVGIAGSLGVKPAAAPPAEPSVLPR